MKQNTKFLWMYVCILFSFAVILIIFAGLSTNKDIQEEKGLKNKVEHVSSENVSFKKQIESLKTENTNLRTENEQIKKDLEEKNASVNTLTETNQILTEEKSNRTNIDELLDNAVKEFEEKNFDKVNEYLLQINTTKLTYSQQYLYNYLMKLN